MNLLKIVFVLGAAAFTIGATYLDTNARRMARGLPPLPPVRRATPVAGMFLCLPEEISITFSSKARKGLFHRIRDQMIDVIRDMFVVVCIILYACPTKNSLF